MSLNILDSASVLLVHAHPDDETISTGALIAEFVARGATVWLLMALVDSNPSTKPSALPPARLSSSWVAAPVIASKSLVA